MRRTKHLLIAAVLAGLLALAMYVVLSSGEPTYQGKTVDRWLDGFAEIQRRVTISLTNLPGSNIRATLDSRQAASTALAVIGPKAVPYIVRRLKLSESPWHHKYHDAYPDWPAWVKKLLPTPSLELSDTEGASAFIDIGPPVEPRLVALLGNDSVSVRTAAAFALGWLNHYDKTDIRNAIPGLTKGVGDGDPELRCMSAMALGYIGPDAASAVGTLTRCLGDPYRGRVPRDTAYVRAATARALGNIGPKSREALPALRVFMTDPDVYVRVVSAVAVWRIDGDVANTLPVLEEGLGKVNSGSTWEVAEGIGEMGPRAKEAAPVLRALLDTSRPPWPPNGDKIGDALKKIDPEPAAKEGAP